MSKPNASVTNEDLMEVLQDIMQIANDGFTQVNAKLDEHSQDIRELKRAVSTINAALEKLSNEHGAYMNDISDILDRIVALEKQAELSKSERKELQRLLQTVVDWIAKASKTLDIPVNFQSS